MEQTAMMCEAMDSPLQNPGSLPHPDAILADLDEDQALILLQTLNRTSLVNAGAGSGKTRLLTSKIAYMIATGQHRPDQILAITFTNKAAREMRERLEKLIGPDAASQVWMGTFHAICIRLLRKFGKPDLGWATFHIIDETEQMQMLRAAAVALRINLKDVDLPSIHRMISWWKNRMVPPKAVMESARQENDHDKYLYGELYQKYMEVCRRARAMDFDDILLYSVWAMRKEDSKMRQFCHNTFRHIMVDEYQDTNNIQSELIRLMRGPECHVMAIGN